MKPVFLTGQSEGVTSGVAGSGHSKGFEIPRVGSGRVGKYFQIARVGSTRVNSFFISYKSDRVESRGFQNLAGRVGTGQVSIIYIPRIFRGSGRVSFDPQPDPTRPDP